MAAKKKTAPKASKKRALKKPVAAAKAATPKPALRPTSAVKLLSQAKLPSTKLRALFRGTFSDAQCTAWGEQTKAANVLAACAAWLPLIDKALRTTSRFAYSPQRFAWLAECVVALEDEVQRTTSDGAQRSVGLRSFAATRAAHERTQLLNGLEYLATGRTELRTEVAQRSGDARTLDGLEGSLAGLIDLANRWRHRDDLRLLCDDADLTEGRLNRAWNALESLHQANEATNELPRGQGDAASVNVIEGRVLRELKVAMRAFDRARDTGLNVPALAVPSSLKALLDRGVADDTDPSTPDPEATPV